MSAALNCSRANLELVVPALVVAEVTYLVGRRLGATTEAAFLRGLSAVEVEAPSVEDWPAIATLVERRVYPETPVRIEYVLTPKGEELREVVKSVQFWADRWVPLETAL